MHRIDRYAARDLLRRCNAYGVDFHALKQDDVYALIETADAHKYRAPRNANGSRARYWHAYLTRRASTLED